MRGGIDAINRLLQELIHRVADTGWIELPLSSYNIIWDAGTVRARQIGKVVTLTIDNIRTTKTVSNPVRIVNQLGQFAPQYDIIIPATAIPSAGIRFGGLFYLHSSGLLELKPDAAYAPAYGVYGHLTYMID